MSYYFKDKLYKTNKIECCVDCGLIGDLYFDESKISCRYCIYEKKLLNGEYVVNINKPCYLCGLYGDCYFYGTTYKTCRICRYALVCKSRDKKRKNKKRIKINRGYYNIKFL